MTKNVPELSKKVKINDKNIYFFLAEEVLL